MKRIYPFILSLAFYLTALLSPATAKADMWGGDVAVLVQILSNAIQTLTVLQQTMEIAKGDSDLLKKVNRDIESALSEIHAIQDTIRDTNEIGKAKDPVEVLNRLRIIYGRLPKIGNSQPMEFADKVSGTALGVDNDAYAHASLIDAAGTKIQGQARGASPGRSQQLTAQSQAVIIHSLAQIERNGGTVARVTATQLAIENQREKNKIESFDQSYSGMTTSRAATKPDMVLGSL
ncbi:MAG: hypothetical protein SGI74_02260 [Oligoflexia bacterium]|nr:hypothetical protein [Oligoflexia bacterium]